MKRNFIYPLCAVGLGLVLLSGGALAADTSATAEAVRRRDRLAFRPVPHRATRRL
jgi:hypothetical protein